jgi:hypothetical protein
MIEIVKVKDRTNLPEFKVNWSPSSNKVVCSLACNEAPRAPFSTAIEGSWNSVRGRGVMGPQASFSAGEEAEAEIIRGCLYCGNVHIKDN